MLWDGLSRASNVWFSGACWNPAIPWGMYGTTNNTIINLPVFFWPIYGGFADSAFLGLPHYGKNYLKKRHHLWPKTEGLGRLKPISDSKNAGDWDPEFWHWSGSLLLVLSALMVMFSHTKLMYVNSRFFLKKTQVSAWILETVGPMFFFWGVVLWPGIASKLPGTPLVVPCCACRYCIHQTKWCNLLLE